VKIRIVAAGKVRPPFLRAAVDDYLSRLRHYLPVEEVEVRPGPAAKTAQSMLRAVPPQHEVWVLDGGGQQPTSDELARLIAGRMDRGTKGIAVLIGASDGLPVEALRAADLVLGLSRLTMPHRLARLVLVEQLYRAMTIIKGEPYDK
jgi:23S rRNA (pseudouridine1915-N3)-methyltransferase